MNCCTTFIIGFQTPSAHSSSAYFFLDFLFYVFATVDRNLHSSKEINRNVSNFNENFICSYLSLSIAHLVSFAINLRLNWREVYFEQQRQKWKIYRKERKREEGIANNLSSQSIRFIISRIIPRVVRLCY